MVRSFQGVDYSRVLYLIYISRTKIRCIRKSVLADQRCRQQEHDPPQFCWISTHGLEFRGEFCCFLSLLHVPWSKLVLRDVDTELLLLSSTSTPEPSSDPLIRHYRRWTQWCWVITESQIQRVPATVHWAIIWNNVHRQVLNRPSASFLCDVGR